MTRLVDLPVPDNAPAGLCWQYGPDDTPHAMAHCDLPEGHDGPHAWQAQVDAWREKVAREAARDDAHGGDVLIARRRAGRCVACGDRPPRMGPNGDDLLCDLCATRRDAETSARATGRRRAPSDATPTLFSGH